MADSAGKLVVEVLKKDCSSLTCPYRAGDSQRVQDKLLDKLDQKLKHRVADGNEVRILEARIELLETAIKKCLIRAHSGMPTTKAQDMAEHLKKALNPKKKDK